MSQFDFNRCITDVRSLANLCGVGVCPASPVRVVVDAIEAPVCPEMHEHHFAGLVSHFQRLRINLFGHAGELRGGDRLRIFRSAIGNDDSENEQRSNLRVENRRHEVHSRKFEQFAILPVSHR